MSFTEVVQTDYGLMMVNKYDQSQTPALKFNRKAFSAGEIALFERYLSGQTQAVFVDIGANTGAFAFALRPYCRKVIAIEAQRIFAYMIAGSIALNGWENVFVYNYALGNKKDEWIPAPRFDYNRPMNFGSIEFGVEQKEPQIQQRQKSVEYVQTHRLDDMIGYATAMKIDVEGMELEVLEGAKNIIANSSPVMLIEFIKCGLEPLQQFLDGIEYNYEIVGEHRMDLWCTPKEWNG